jgi:hypothetical protein
MAPPKEQGIAPLGANFRNSLFIASNNMRINKNKIIFLPWGITKKKKIHPSVL